MSRKKSATLAGRAKALRERFRDDFVFYAARCLYIRQKNGAVKPMVLNAAQRYIHERIEKQLADTGQVRTLIVKGRQQGCSTYVEGRFFWKITHRPGVRAYVMSHLEAASRNLAQMMTRFYTLCPPVMRPQLTRSNQKALEFGILDSAYKIGTAKSSGAGRSDTVQYFHASEVAYWSHAREHIAGILQSIPEGGGTEVIFESTSNGPEGQFYEMCMAAARNENGYILIFVSWFWQPEYRRTAEDNFTLTPEEQAYKKAYDLSDDQMAWRRHKIAELGGHWVFRREYPASMEEAFRSDAPGALWTRDGLNSRRCALDDCPEFKRVVVAVDPAVTSGAQSDETGIIVAGLGINDHAYILKDVSGRYTPGEWAARACAVYDEYQADAIVIETNQGGDMALHTLKTCDPYVPVKKIHASRGKWARAEPVAALDEQGRVHHVGQLPDLEDQMCRFVPGQMAKSPDSVDARVWAVTELLLGRTVARPKVWRV